MTKVIQKWLPDLPAILLFIVMPLFCFPELFFQSKTLYASDLAWIHYPLHLFVAEQWQSWHIPLWNPYTWSGFPLLAEGQVGVLYPLNILFCLPIPTYYALTLFVTIHFTLATTFTYILSRSLNISRAGATIGGLSFGFGGFLMAQVTNLNVMTGGAWLPLVFWGIYQTLRLRRWQIAVLSGIPLALQILTSQPQLVFYTLLLVGSYILYHTILIIRKDEHWPIEIIRSWAWAFVAILTGLLLAAPQLIPTWELKNLSVRADGLTYDLFISHSLAPLGLLNLLLPGLFGNHLMADYKGLAGNFIETYIYVGILPLVMALYSWRERHQPMITFFWLVIPISLLLAFGRFTPLAELLYHVPYFNLFRVAGRWSLLANFALAMLAAQGVDVYLRQPAHRRWLGGFLAIWLTLASGFILLSIYQQPLLEWSNQFANPNHLLQTWQQLLQYNLWTFPQVYQDRLILSSLSWWLMPPVALLSRLGLTIVLLISYAFHRLSANMLTTLAIILTMIDLMLSGGTAINDVTRADFWQQQSPAAHYIIEAQSGNLNRFLQVSKANAALDAVASLGEYFPTVAHTFAMSGHEDSLLLNRSHIFFEQLKANPLLALKLTGTRFLLTDKFAPNSDNPVLPLVYHDENWYVYEYHDFLPRALLVHQALAVKDGDEALIELQKPTFDPQQTVLIETTAPLPPLTATQKSHDNVVIINYEPTLVELTTTQEQAAFLLLLDTYYPGWQAEVDGQPTPIWQANYFARAIYLNAGTHTVRFIYRPWSFQLGSILSLMGGFMVIIALISLIRLFY